MNLLKGTITKTNYTNLLMGYDFSCPIISSLFIRIKKGPYRPFFHTNLILTTVAGVNYLVKLNINLFKRVTKLAGSFKLPRSANIACSYKTSVH